MDKLTRLRTTGFHPLRPGRIHLRCPGCGRKYSNMMRAEDGQDPKKAVLAEICCDRCCLGHKDCGPQYFDVKGRSVPWEPTE
jgi:hypothetical protein